MYGWDVEVVAWSRFLWWNLIKLCVWTALVSYYHRGFLSFFSFAAPYSYHHRNPWKWETLTKKTWGWKISWRRSLMKKCSGVTVLGSPEITFDRSYKVSHCNCQHNIYGTEKNNLLQENKTTSSSPYLSSSSSWSRAAWSIGFCPQFGTSGARFDPTCQYFIALSMIHSNSWNLYLFCAFRFIFIILWIYIFLRLNFVSSRL